MYVLLSDFADSLGVQEPVHPPTYSCSRFPGLTAHYIAFYGDPRHPLIVRDGAVRPSSIVGDAHLPENPPADLSTVFRFASVPPHAQSIDLSRGAAQEHLYPYSSPSYLDSTLPYVRLPAEGPLPNLSNGRFINLGTPNRAHVVPVDDSHPHDHHLARDDPSRTHEQHVDAARQAAHRADAAASFGAESYFAALISSARGTKYTRFLEKSYGPIAVAFRQQEKILGVGKLLGFEAFQTDSRPPLDTSSAAQGARGLKSAEKRRRLGTNPFMRPEVRKKVRSSSASPSRTFPCRLSCSEPQSLTPFEHLARRLTLAR